MHGSKFRNVMFNLLNRMRRNCHSFPHNYGLNNQNLSYRVLRPDLQGELLEEFRVIYAYPLYLLLLTPFRYKRKVYEIRNDRWRMIPLPWKTGEPFPSQGGGGGVLPPTPPIPDSEPPVSENFRDLFEDFNRGSDELPPLELIEEDDIPRMEETQRISGQDGDATSSRPPRQLRNRSVARSVKGSKNVTFCEFIECIEQDQCFREKIQDEGKGTLFPSSQHRDDIDAMPRERWEILFDPTHDP